MDFDTFYYKLNENIDTTNYVEKYKKFGQTLKDEYYISSIDDTFKEITMAAYFNVGILYRFHFKTINKTTTLKKILRLVKNKQFEIRPSQCGTSTVVEVAYLFKDIERISSREKSIGNSL